MHRWRPYLLTVVVTAALLAVVAATVMIFGREQIVFEEHIAEFARFWMENTTNETIVADNVGYVPNTEEEKQANLDTLESAIEAASE